MSHPLEAIIVVQKKDRKLIKLMRKIRDIPQRKSDVELQLAGTKKKLEMAKTSKMHTETSLKDLELEVELLKERVNKYKVQQMEANTNDQYRAFVKEIGTVERDITQLEEKELELMEALERGKQIEIECAEKLKVEEEGISDELDELSDREEELTEQLNKIKADRARVVAQCDQDVLRKYVRIMNNKRDFAVVMIEPGRHCGGCHMELPPQVANDARNPTKIVACNFCGRIVYNP